MIFEPAIDCSRPLLVFPSLETPGEMARGATPQFAPYAALIRVVLVRPIFRAFLGSGEILLTGLRGTVFKHVESPQFEPGDNALANDQSGSTLTRVGPLTAIAEDSGYNAVVVKSRVNGPILQTAFREGQKVLKRDLLAVIDPTTYSVAFIQATALRDKDATALSQARADFDRYSARYDEVIISKQGFER